MPLATGIVHCYQIARRNRIRLGKQHQRRHKLRHIIDTLHAIAIENGLVGSITAGQGSAVGHCHGSRQVTFTDLDRHNGYLSLPGFFQGGNKFLRMPAGLQEQANHPGVRQVQHEIQVVFHRQAKLLACGGSKTES